MAMRLLAIGLGAFALIALLVPGASAKDEERPYLRDLSRVADGSGEPDPFGRILSWASFAPQFGLARVSDVGFPSAEEVCESPELRTPTTLNEASRDGIAVSLVCAKDVSAEVELLVSHQNAEDFKLGSRVIGSGTGEFVAGERDDVIAHLKPETIEAMSRLRDETVYLKAALAD